MITRLCDCTIRQFMRGLFDKKYEDFGDAENFDKLFTEYVDVSGLAITRQYEIHVQLHNIYQRQTLVNTYLKLEAQCLVGFGAPSVQGTQGLRSLGHRLKWDAEKNDIDGYVNQLKMVELRERKHISEQDKLVKELARLKMKGVTQESEREQKHSFVKMINNIGKEYDIDRDKTDMEAFSLMIKEFNEEIEMKSQALAMKRYA